jgi:hypothetical protein
VILGAVTLEVEFRTAGARTRAIADEEGLRIASRGLRREAPWHTLTGGGIARARTIELEGMGPEGANVLPGLRRLAEASRKMTDAHRLLVLAQARARGRPRVVLVPIPVDDPNAEVLLVELKRRLGRRWLGEDFELKALKRELGASYPRWYWAAGLLFVLFTAAATISAIAGWGQLVSENANLAGLESRWLVGLAVWIGFVAVILFLVRGLTGENEWRPWAMAAPIALLLALLAPTAVVTYRLATDGKLSGVQPAGLVVLALWLALAALFVSFVRRRLG